MRNNRECNTCLMSAESDPNIRFNAEGVCNHCITYIKKTKSILERNNKQLLDQTIKTIKNKRKGKYDCVIGISGGTDSSYVAYLTKKWGLNPLAVHVDNGWNSELSVRNIENILDKLNIDLFTYVIEWKEFRNLQRAYFEASVVDIEALTDHAITAVLLRVANEFDIRFVLSGESTITEGVLPNHWVHNKSDFKNIRDIVKKHGNQKFVTYPLLQNKEKTELLKNISSILILDFVDYNKNEAKTILKKELAWTDYGGKHYESIFTKFYQGYILPNKFNIDKRISHLSTLIIAGQMTKEQGKIELKKPAYPLEDLQRDKMFILKKLNFTEEYFQTYMKKKARSHFKYKSTTSKFRRLLSKLKNYIKKV